MQSFRCPVSAPASLDARQFDLLLRQLMPDLSRYARSLARDPDLAQDLVQEAAVRAWGGRASFTVGTNFKAWLYRILRNAFLSHRRRGIVAKTDSYGDDLPETPVAPGQENAIVLLEVERHWQRLTSPQRRAIELIAIDGHSYEEAAEIEDVSLGTIKSRVARGRNILLALHEGNALTSGTRAAHKRVCVGEEVADDEILQPLSITARSISPDITDRSQIELLRTWRMQRADLRAKAA